MFAENLLKGDSSFETGLGRSIVNSHKDKITWQIDPSNAVYGNQCIKLKYNARGWTYSYPIEISQENNGKTFIFSAYIKSPMNGICGRLCIFDVDFWGPHTVHGTNFIVTNAWKRYSVTGKLKKGIYQLAICMEQPCDIWVDALQFEEGDTPSEYQNNVPDSSIGIMLPAENNYIFSPEENIVIQVSGLSISRSWGNNLTCLLTIRDYLGIEIASKEIQVSPVMGHFMMTYTFSTSALGWFKITAHLIENKRIIAQETSSFCIINPPVETKKGLTPFCGMVTSLSPIVKRIGAKWIELSGHWKDLEPQKGKYNLWDWNFSNISESGMKIKYNLGHLPSAPEWSWDPSEVAEAKEMQITPSSFLPAQFHLESWREFIREFMVHYKGQFSIVEIGGEDDLAFGGNPYYCRKYQSNVHAGKLAGGAAYDRYSEMIRIACEEIRKIDPTQKIGIVRPSGVDCTDARPQYFFSSPTIKKCKYLFDLFPLDCYCYPRYLGPEQPETPVPEDFLPGDLSKAREACKINGIGQPLYISEFGYALDINVQPDSAYALDLIKRIARTHLIARMEGCESLHWFTDNWCLEGEKYHYGLWRFGMPLPSVPAYSAVARIVENVEGIKELALGGDSKAVVFKKDDRADAAVWFVRGSGKLKLKEMPEDLLITDVMGNRISVKNTLDIGEFPVYLEMSGSNSFDKMLHILAQSEMICMPVKTYFITPRIDRGILQLKNITGADIDARLQIDQKVKNISLKKGLTINIEVPINKNNIDILVDCGDNYEKINVSYPIVFESCPWIDFNGKIDADLSEWNGRPFIAMNERSQIMPPDPWINYKGPEYFSAKIYTGWDGKYFYMAAEVKDDFHSNQFPGEIYKGDCIQFAFDPKADSLKAGYGADDKEMGMALVDGKPAFVQWVGQGIWNDCEYVVKRDDTAKKTFYEIRIPLASLGIAAAKGTAFGFNFVIFNDDTGAGSNYYYQLGPGIAGGKNPAAFKKFVLE